jgi:ATP-dependent Clp protease ATP-binding subunit ClpA
MQRQQLLNLLDRQARDVFEAAKRIALANGGALSPLHIVAAVLESTGSGQDEKEQSSLLQSVRDAIETRYPRASETIIVPKETQSIISEAARLAKLDGNSLASPTHLLRAALRSPTVTEALGDTSHFEPALSEAFANSSRQLSAATSEEQLHGHNLSGQKQQAGSSSLPNRALAGALNDYCSDVAQELLASSSHPFVGREREITAVLETLCRKV